jgi:hypothetical protein
VHGRNWKLFWRNVRQFAANFAAARIHANSSELGLSSPMFTNCSPSVRCSSREKIVGERGWSSPWMIVRRLYCQYSSSDFQFHFHNYGLSMIAFCQMFVRNMIKWVLYLE